MLDFLTSISSYTIHEDYCDFPVLKPIKIQDALDILDFLGLESLEDK